MRCRDTDVFGVRSVVEQQIFAQIFQASTAVETLQARSRVRGYDALSGMESRDIASGLNDVAGQFMAEDCGGDDHARVVSAPEHFDVGAAGQRGLHSDQNVVFANLRNRHRFNL